VQDHCQRLTEKYPGSLCVVDPAQVLYCICTLFEYLYKELIMLQSLCRCDVSRQFLNTNFCMIIYIRRDIFSVMMLIKNFITFKQGITTTPQPFYGPFSGTTQMSQCQKRTSGLYGARED